MHTSIKKCNYFSDAPEIGEFEQLKIGPYKRPFPHNCSLPGLRLKNNLLYCFTMGDS